jgi:hypothetical protein
MGGDRGLRSGRVATSTATGQPDERTADCTQNSGPTALLAGSGGASASALDAPSRDSLETRSASVRGRAQELPDAPNEAGHGAAASAGAGNAWGASLEQVLGELGGQGCEEYRARMSDEAG